MSQLKDRGLEGGVSPSLSLFVLAQSVGWSPGALGGNLFYWVTDSNVSLIQKHSHRPRAKFHPIGHLVVQWSQHKKWTIAAYSTRVNEASGSWGNDTKWSHRGRTERFPSRRLFGWHSLLLCGFCLFPQKFFNRNILMPGFKAHSCKFYTYSSRYLQCE